MKTVSRYSFKGPRRKGAYGEYVAYEDYAALVDDARRYQWLRDQSVLVNGAPSVCEYDCDGDPILGGILYGPELDEAIDAAMSG